MPTPPGYHKKVQALEDVADKAAKLQEKVDDIHVWYAEKLQNIQLLPDNSPGQLQYRQTLREEARIRKEEINQARKVVELELGALQANEAVQVS